MSDSPIKMLAPAKINYVLEIGNKRADGYHDIDTVFQTISLADKIYLQETSREVALTTNVDNIGAPESNLVVRAAELLKRVLGINKGVHIHLEKNIPAGAGLGGGSSDAATTLKGLVRLWELNLKKEDLFKFAVQLGSDVPFFLDGGIAIGRSRGEKITLLSKGAKPKLNLVLVCPDFSVSTKWAYKIWDEEQYMSRGDGLDSFLNALYKKDIRVIAGNLYNDFEQLVIDNYPPVGKIKSILIENGALGTLMTGSGSAVFGVFADGRRADDVAEKISYMGKVFRVTTI